ncbi:MAG: hypothetical protein LBF60_05610 [Treponema sp.]|nr:hypothetical protein [Treponema sp.]
MKIDCRPPVAKIICEKNERNDSAGMRIADNTVGNSLWVTTFVGGNNALIRMGLPYHSTSDPPNPSSSPSIPCTTGGSPLLLGDADYDALKVKLIVMVEKGGAKAYAYESANKTVVEFSFTSTVPDGDYNGGGGREIGWIGKPGASALISEEKLWIRAGIPRLVPPAYRAIPSHGRIRRSAYSLCSATANPPPPPQHGAGCRGRSARQPT